MELALQLIEELALLLVVAAGLAYGLARLHVPPVLGYLLAGVVLGPSGFGWIRQAEFVRALGDLGVVLIMFGLGLDFELARLRRAATLSVVAGVASVLLTFVAVNAAAVLIGFRPLQALFLAAAFSICGTAVNLRILSDLGHLKREHGQPIAAVIVVTDIAAVLLLTALSGIALGGGLDPLTVAGSLFKATAFLVLVPAFGFLAVPRLLNGVALVTRSREVLLITTLALCFGLALVSQWLGFSLALGAFVMGMVVSEARVYHPIEEMTKPLEHVFGTLFFLSVGLSVRISAAFPYLPAIAVFVVLITLTRVASVGSVTYLSGFTGLAALAAGWGLVPIGEFSFVIINEGLRFGVLPQEALAVAVVIALATALLAVGGLLAARLTVERLTHLMPVSVLNLLTVLQLRATAGRAVPGLARVATGPAPGSAFDPEQNRRAVWRELQEIGINAVIVVTVTLGLAALGDVLVPRLPASLDVQLVPAAAAIVLCAPSAVFIFRSGADLARLLSQALAARFAWVDSGMMRGALVAASSFLTFVFLQVAFLPLLLVRLKNYSVPVLVVAGALALALAYLLFRAAQDFQRGLTGLVRTSLASAVRGAGREAANAAGGGGGGSVPPGGAGVVPAGRAGAVPAGATGAPRVGAAARTKPRRRPDAEGAGGEPYRTMIDHVRIPGRSSLAGGTLGDSGLQEKTGVTVLGIERRGDWMANPDPGVRLEGDDELVVIGSEEQREQAEELLARSEDKRDDGRPRA